MKKDLFFYSGENGGGGTVRDGSSISGTISVSDFSGSPNGAEVTLIDSSGEVAGTYFVENDSGAYTFEGIPDGIYTVEAALEGYTTGVTGPIRAYSAHVSGVDLTLLRTITGLRLAAALDAVKAAGSGDFLIKLGADESDVVNYDVSGFSTPANITIDGEKSGGGTYNIGWASGTASNTGCLTLSQAELMLTIKNITFTGVISNRTQPLVWIKSGGIFKMQDGAILTGNLASNGGAVYVANGGTFIMEGGSITGNRSSGYGHGVYVAGTMTMTGGSITRNVHRTNENGPNDVSVYAFSGYAGVLHMSGDARIEHLYLYYITAQSFGIIVTDAAFSGTESVAILDLYDGATFNGKQILRGEAVASTYERFTPGVGRSNFSGGSGTPLTGKLDNTGVWNQ
jgi:hypothetical protein